MFVFATCSLTTVPITNEIPWPKKTLTCPSYPHITCNNGRSPPTTQYVYHNSMATPNIHVNVPPTSSRSPFPQIPPQGHLLLRYHLKVTFSSDSTSRSPSPKIPPQGHLLLKYHLKVTFSSDTTSRSPSPQIPKVCILTPNLILMVFQMIWICRETGERNVSKHHSDGIFNDLKLQRKQ